MYGKEKHTYHKMFHLEIQGPGEDMGEFVSPVENITKVSCVKTIFTSLEG